MLQLRHDRSKKDEELWQVRRFKQDRVWLKTLLDSIDGRARVRMPSFPPQDYQSEFVGSSDEHAIREAWAFYTFMARQRETYGLTLGAETHVLDFGCGWGRFARMFLRDVPTDNIWCADPQGTAIAMCRETGVPGRMVALELMPPSTLPSGRFDTAFAYSVFSHLSPIAHAAWSAEFARVMKPGGLVFVTLQARWFLDMCQELRDKPELVTHLWYEDLAASFLDHDDALARYDRGEFLYVPNRRAEEQGKYYGDAVVPYRQIELMWSDSFEILDFVADRSQFEQAIVVMRRRM
jgi:SAM-dependent methyltransferase